MVEASKVRNDVILEGSIGAFSEALGVELTIYEHADGEYRGHSQPLHLPDSIADLVETVVGLDEMPCHRRHDTEPATTVASESGVTPQQMAEYYKFPKHSGTATSRLAILEFGGGYFKSEMVEYFGASLPAISPILVGQGRNNPLPRKKLHAVMDDIAAGLTYVELYAKYGPVLTDFENTLEVTMDIQIAGSLANHAAIDVYFASGTGYGYYTAINAASGEPVGKRSSGDADLPSAISISWGDSEWKWPHQYLSAINRALEGAKNKGITVCCSAGDFGSRNDPPGPGSNWLANVCFPASSPYALACGGTMFENPSWQPKNEEVWNQELQGGRLASGGGFSGYFPQPKYQQGHGIAAPGLSMASTYRGLPDVAGYADCNNGYRIRLGGTDTASGTGGTSAAAPLWAALITLLTENLGRPVGWSNPLLYGPQLQGALNDVTQGDDDVANGTILSFSAQPGWDACTGFGTPNGEPSLGH